MKKWATVDLQGGSVEICKDLLYQKGLPKGKLWEAFVASDLDGLRRPVDPVYRLALGGIACSAAYPMLSAKTPYVAAKALLGRVFRMPKTSPAAGIYRWLDQFVPELLPDYVTERYTFPEWLLTMPGARRKPLLKAWEEYQRRGWVKSNEKFSTFVKVEALPGFAKDNAGLTRLREMLDRVIQGPNDVTHTIAGPVLKPLIKLLKKRWNSDNCIFYGSTSPEELHKWLQTLVARPGLYFWCDYSMYDNTHSDDSWDFMERLYAATAGDDPAFRKVMEAWRRPKGKIGPLRYKARVMNASGRDDTALSNGVLNGFAAFLSIVAAYLGRPLLSLTVADVNKCKSEILLSVCGDDSLGRVPSMTETRRIQFERDVSANIAMFGFEAKLQTSYQLFDAVYLGNRPYPTRKGWFWGKTIGRATYKNGFTVVEPGNDLMAKITGIADMHMLCSVHVPVLYDLAKKICELRAGAKRTPVRLDPNKPWEWTTKGGVPYDDLTLQAVAETYLTRRTCHNLLEPVDVSLGVEELKDLIRQIDGVTRLPCVIDSPTWRRIIHVDDM